MDLLPCVRYNERTITMETQLVRECLAGQKCERNNRWVERLGMENVFVRFCFCEGYEDTYDVIYEGNEHRERHRDLIYKALKEFAIRTENTANYLLKHFGTDIRVVRPLHATGITDTHFNILGLNGKTYHIFTNRAGFRITKITYMCEDDFAF